jgi:hypothetical protein
LSYCYLYGTVEDTKTCAKCFTRQTIDAFNGDDQYCVPCRADYQYAYNVLIPKKTGKECRLCRQSKELLQLGPMGKNGQADCLNCLHTLTLIGNNPKKRLSRLLDGARDRAKDRSTKFSISSKDILNIWPQDNKCPVCLVLMERTKDGSPKPNSPSLDCIQPKLGYIMDNIAIICYRCNCCKSNETDPEAFFRIGRWLQLKLLKP